MIDAEHSAPPPTAVIAHRGASRAAPENTVEAFLTAARMGADAVELDVRRTADGVLVVHHDPRLADTRVIVATPYRDLPAHVPTLAAALDACAGMWVNVEIKNDAEEPDFDPTDSIADDTIAHAQLSPSEPWSHSRTSVRTFSIGVRIPASAMRA